MRRRLSAGPTLLLAVVAMACTGRLAAAAKTVAYVGVQYDVTDFSSTGLNIGRAGFWFPQFHADTTGGGVAGRPTDENDRNSLPAWAPMNFTTIFSDPTRTFSLDNGGVKSEGGDPAWATLKLPDGEVGLSGSVVDPRTVNNSNNSINKIVLTAGTAGDPLPPSFLLHIVVDNTNGEHDPVNRLRPRAQTADGSVDVGFQLSAADLQFNRVPDVYTFRYDGWEPTDFIKLQLSGAAAPATGAGFAGLMFDVVPEPATGGSLSLAALGWGAMARRRLRR